MKVPNKFDDMAQYWWDDSMHMLHKLNKARSDAILSILRSYHLLDANILDLGCGGGLLTESLFKGGVKKVTGIDISLQGIQIAKQHASESNLEINYINCDLDEYLAEGNKCEVITSMEVVEHLDDPVDFIKKCYHAIPNGGMLFISSVNRTIKSMIFAKFIAEYVMRYVPVGTHNWGQFVKPSDIAIPLINLGAKDLNIIGFKYSIVSGKFYPTTRLDMNYLLSVRKP